MDIFAFFLAGWLIGAWMARKHAKDPAYFAERFKRLQERLKG